MVLIGHLHITGLRVHSSGYLMSSHEQTVPIISQPFQGSRWTASSVEIFLGSWKTKIMTMWTCFTVTVVASIQSVISTWIWQTNYYFSNGPITTWCFPRQARSLRPGHTLVQVLASGGYNVGLFDLTVRVARYLIFV